MRDMTRFASPGDRLTYARGLAGYETQKDFYTQHDIPQSTYSLHENGRRSLTNKKAEEYASLLKNVTAAWLLYEEGDGPDAGAAAGGPPEIFDPQESEALTAYMVLYDRITALTEQADETGEREFGFVSSAFGYDKTQRGLVLMLFRLWQHVINESDDLPLIDRVFKTIAWFEDHLQRTRDVMRHLRKGIEHGNSP